MASDPPDALQVLCKAFLCSQVSTRRRLTRRRTCQRPFTDFCSRFETYYRCQQSPTSEQLACLPEIQRHLKTYPYDTEFVIERTPGTGYG